MRFLSQGQGPDLLPHCVLRSPEGLGLRPTKWHLAALSTLPPGSLVSLGWGWARSGGGWLLAQLGRAVPASVLERIGILEMVASSSSLGTQASNRGVERMRLWGQTWGLIAILPLI